MRRRRRKKRDQGSVEMNLAAMLDMAFQLLTFFILTFRPAPIEGQLALNMPPPVAQTSVKPTESTGEGTMGEVMQANILHLNVMAGEHGDVNEIKVEDTPIVQGRFDEANSQRLDAKLKSTLKQTGDTYDRVQIAVDGRLRYGELMKVIDVCHRQKLADGTQMQKISFAEVMTGGASGSK